MRGSMYEMTCRNLLEEYEILSFIKRDACSLVINLNCDISNEKWEHRLVDFYMKEEKVKQFNWNEKKKKDTQRSIFNVKTTWRCH